MCHLHFETSQTNTKALEDVNVMSCQLKQPGKATRHRVRFIFQELNFKTTRYLSYISPNPGVDISPRSSSTRILLNINAFLRLGGCWLQFYGRGVEIYIYIYIYNVRAHSISVLYIYLLMWSR
jgi:hypothetical protein